MKIMLVLNSGFSGAINPLNASGRLKRNPKSIPCNAQFIRKVLIPIARPIKVLLAIICTLTGHGIDPEPDAMPKHISPHSIPHIVAMVILFIYNSPFDIFILPRQAWPSYNIRPFS